MNEYREVYYIAGHEYAGVWLHKINAEAAAREILPDDYTADERYARIFSRHVNDGEAYANVR